MWENDRPHRRVQPHNVRKPTAPKPIQESRLRNTYSCPCGHNFCYTCGLRWYTCACEGPDVVFEEPNPHVADMLQAMRDDQLFQGLLRIGHDLPVWDMIAQINALVADVGPVAARQEGLRDVIARAFPEPITEPELDHRDRNHEGWRFVHGAGECEHCDETLPLFTMECETCQMRACRRCMLNRLWQAAKKKQRMRVMVGLVSQCPSPLKENSHAAQGCVITVGDKRCPVKVKRHERLEGCEHQHRTMLKQYYCVSGQSWQENVGKYLSELAFTVN